MSHKPDMICEQEGRRHEVRQNAYLNGLDYLEIAEGPMRRDQPIELTVFFLDKAPRDLRPENIRISGGARVHDLKAIDLELCINRDPDLDDCMIVTLDRPGDLSTYTLCIVDLDEDGRPSDRLHPGFDPRYACLDFDFRINCASDLDCKTAELCPPEPLAEPEIDYLAKDYASFRQLILDRLSVIMPDWQERHVPDLGITLVELLAYTGDYLSYYQDSVATEAYLKTARQRISVRRHARLADYAMHEGNNARAWVCIRPQARLELDPKDFYLITHYESAASNRSEILTEVELQSLSPGRYEVFEPVVEPAGSLRFTPEDLKAPGCLVVKLQDQKESVSKFLYEAMPLELQEAVQHYTGDSYEPLDRSIGKALLDILNQALEWPDLYDRKRFAGVELGAQTRQLVAKPARGGAVMRLNRALLEDAYPAEIARRRRPDAPFQFYEQLNRISFYTWGDADCCLPSGSTQATLLDGWDEQESTPPTEDGYRRQKQAPEQPEQRTCDRLRKLRHLQPGDMLVLEEALGPKTGEPADADPKHRHAVRLTRVEATIDPLNKQPIVEIEWHPADALPFPLCISAPPTPPECQPLTDVSVACGNVILVDHGRRIGQEDLGCAPLAETEERCDEPCHPAEVIRRPGKYRPRLKYGPLVFYQPLDRAGTPASTLLEQDPRQALPWLRLDSWPNPNCLPDDEITEEAEEIPVEETGSKWPWTPRSDLLSSQAWDAHFVAEIDNEGRARLRFGDGELGRMPDAAHRFQATYRIGGGPQGNVGAERIAHLVHRQDRLVGHEVSIGNPLPARGGTAPETLTEVKQFAPFAFRRELARAITAEDYAAIVMRDFKDLVQRAAATLRWTGSWYEVLVVVDPLGTIEAEPSLLAEIEAHLARFRRIGHDVAVRSAHVVSLELHLDVCVQAHYLRGHVKAALLDLFSNRCLPDGNKGFFHPDRLTFGEGLYLSEIVAAAQAVAGVESVDVIALQRLGAESRQALDSGVLPFGPLEIARLDNDPNYPENGKLILTLRGGR